MFKKFKRIISASLSAIMILSSGGNLIVPHVYAEPAKEQTQIEEPAKADESKMQLFADEETDAEGNPKDNTKAHLYVDILKHYPQEQNIYNPNAAWQYANVVDPIQGLFAENGVDNLQDLLDAGGYGSLEEFIQNEIGYESLEAYLAEGTVDISYKPLYFATGNTAPSGDGQTVLNTNRASMSLVDPLPDPNYHQNTPVESGQVKAGDVVYLGVRIADVANVDSSYAPFYSYINSMQMSMYYDSTYLSLYNKGYMDNSKVTGTDISYTNMLTDITELQTPSNLIKSVNVKDKKWGYTDPVTSARLYFVGPSSNELWGSSYLVDGEATIVVGHDDYYTGLPSLQALKNGDKPVTIGQKKSTISNDDGVSAASLNNRTLAKLEVTINLDTNNKVANKFYPRKLSDNDYNYILILPFYVKQQAPAGTQVVQFALEKDKFVINNRDLTINPATADGSASMDSNDARNKTNVSFSAAAGDPGTGTQFFYNDPKPGQTDHLENYLQFMGDADIFPAANTDPTPEPAKPILTVTGKNVTIAQSGTVVPAKSTSGTGDTTVTTYELDNDKVYTATVTSFDDGKKFSAWTIGTSGEGGASNIALEAGSAATKSPINFKISGDETLTYATADKTQPKVYIGSEDTTSASYNRQTGTGGVTVTLKGGDYTYNNKVKLDGAEVATTNYTYNSTANTVTFSDAYLKSLPIDTAKTFTFEFTGDTAVTNPTVTITLSDTSTYLNEVQIDKQPVLIYTHGDKLNLTGLEFTVKRGQKGNPESTKQFKYDGTQWVSDATYSGAPYDEVTITLNDGSTGTAVTAGNEKGQITVRRDTHNTKKITVTPKNKSTATTEDTNPGFSLFAAEKYAIVSADTTALTVDQKALPVTAEVSSAVSQEYAGTVSGNVDFNSANKAKVTVTPDSSAVVSGDTVTASASAPAFKGFHAATYTGDAGIDLGTVSLGGTHASNYTVGTVTNNVTGTITAKTVNVTIKNENIPSKVAGTVTKDGTYGMTGDPTISGIVAADSAIVSVVGKGTNGAWVYSYVANTSHNALSADPEGGKKYAAKVGAELKFTDNAYKNDYVLSVTDGVYYSADEAAVVTARTIKDITATAQSKTFTHGDAIDTTAGVKDAAFKVTWSDDSYTTYKYGTSGWEIDTANSNYTSTSFANSGVTVSWKKGNAALSGTPNAEYGSTYSYKATGASKTVALVNYTVVEKDIYVKLAKAAADTNLNKTYDGNNNVADGKVVAEVYSDSTFAIKLTGVTVTLSNVQYKRTGTELADKDAGANKNITATAAAPTGYNIVNTIAALTGAEIKQKAITISSVTNVPTADQNKAATADEKKTGSGSIASGVGSETVYYEYEVTYTTADLAGNVNSTPTLNVTNGANGYTAVATPAGKPTNTGYVPANYTLTGPATVTGKIANPGVGTPKSLKITTLPTLTKTYGDNGVSLENMKVTRTLYGANSADGDVEVYEYKSGSWKKSVNSGAASNVSDVPFTYELVKDGSTSKNVGEVVTLDHAGYAVKVTDKNYTELTDKGGSITVGKKALTLNITYTGVEKTYNGNGTIGTVADILGTGITGSATFAQGSDTLTAASGKVTLKGAADVVTLGQTEDVVVDLSKITASVTAGTGTNNYEKFGKGSKGITTTTATGYYDLTDKYTVTVNGTGNITIQPMALTVKAVTGIPSIELGASIENKVPDQNAKLKDTSGSATAEIEVNETPVSGEALTFTYSYQYSKNTPKGDDTAVAITDVAMASNTGVNANYTISGGATATGQITGKAIETLIADKTKKAYVHGEQLGDLSDLTITANGTNYTLAQWKNMGGTVTIAGISNGSEAYPAATTVMRYDNTSATGGASGTPKTLLLTVTAPSELTTLSLFANKTATVNLTVARRPVSMSAALKDNDNKVTKEFNNEVDVPSTEYNKISYTLGAVSGKTESGVLSGDTVTLSATPAYTDKNYAVGTKTIKFSSPTLGEADASCYVTEGSISNLTNAGTINKRKVKLKVTLPTTVYEGETDTYNIGKTAAANDAKWTAVHLNSSDAEDEEIAFYSSDQHVDEYTVNAKYASTATASNSVSVTCSVAAQLNNNYDVTTDSPITGKVTENGFTISVDNPKTATLSHGDVITESYNADTAVKLTWTNGKVTIYKYESGGWILDDAKSTYKLSYADAVANKGLSIAFRTADSVTPGTTKADYSKADKKYIVQASATGVTEKDVLTYTVKQKEVYVKAVKKSNSTTIEKTYNGNNTYDNTDGNIVLSLTTDAAGNNSYTGTTIASSAITFVKTGDGYAFNDKDAGAKKMHVTATVDGNHKIVGYINNDDSATPITGTIKQKEITVNPTIPPTAKNTKATADKVVNGSGTYTDSVTSETVSYTFDATYPLSYVKSGTTPVPNVPISNYAIADATNNHNYKIVNPNKGEGTIAGVADGSVTGISITKMPDDSDYEYGDALDLTGMQITAKIQGMSDAVYTYGGGKWKDAGGSEVTGIDVKIKKGSNADTAIPGQLTLNNNGSNLRAFYDGFDATSAGTITVGKKQITLTINYPDGMEKLYNKSTVFKTIDKITGTTFDVNGTAATANANNVIEITGAFNGEKISVDTTRITANTSSANANSAVSLAALTTGDSTITYTPGTDKDNYNVTIAQNNKTVKINPYPITITVGGGAVPAITLGETDLDTDVTGASESGTGANKITVAKTNSADPAIPDNTSAFTVNYTYAYDVSGPTTDTAVTVTASGQTLTAPTPVTNYDVTWAQNLSGSIAAKGAAAADFTLTAPTKTEYIHGQNLELDGLKVTYQGKDYIYSTDSNSEWVKNGNRLYLVKGSNGADLEIKGGIDGNNTMQLRYDGEYTGAESGNKKQITFKVQVPKNITVLPTGSAAAASLFAFTEDGTYYSDTFTVNISKREIETITSDYADGITSIDKEYNNSADADASKAVLTPAAAENDTTNVIGGDTVTITKSAKYQDGAAPADTDKNASETAKNIVFSSVAVGAKADGNNNDCYVVKSGTTVNNLSGKISKRPITITVNSVPVAYLNDSAKKTLTSSNYTATYGGTGTDNTAFYGSDGSKYTFYAEYASTATAETVNLTRTYECSDPTVDGNYEISWAGRDTATVLGAKVESLAASVTNTTNTHGDGTSNTGLKVVVGYVGDAADETYVYKNADGTYPSDGWYLDGSVTPANPPFTATWEDSTDSVTSKLSNAKNGKKIVISDSATENPVADSKTDAITINKKEVTVTLTGNAKKEYNKSDNMAMSDGVWDGITAVLTGANLISGEQVKVDNTLDTVIKFSTANVHSSTAITVGTLSLTGTGSDYYTIKATDGVTNNATGSITAKPINVTIGGSATKTYDGTATVDNIGSLTVTSEGIISGDTVGFAAGSEFEFADADGNATVNASSTETWAATPAAKVRAKSGDKTKVSLNNSNYSINVINAGGTGTINQFGITVTGISNIPSVALGGSTNKVTGNKATSGTTDETYKSQLTITETIPNSDVITATYSYQYTDTNSSGTVTSTISDVALDTNILKQNYTLTSNVSGQTGEIDPEDIEGIAIVNASNYAYTKDYIHGQALTTDDIYIVVNEDNDHRKYTAAQWLTIGGKLDVAGIGEYDKDNALPTDAKVRFDNASAGTEVSGKKPITITATAPADNKLTQLFSMLFSGEKTAEATIYVSRKQLTAVTPTKSSGINREYDGTTTADKSNITFALNDSDIVVKTAPSTKDEVSINKDAVTADYFDGTNKVSGASDTARAITFGKADTADTILTGTDADCYIAPAINNLENAGKITKRRLLLTVTNVPSVSVGTTGAGLVKDTAFSAAHRSDNLTTSGVVADTTGITTDTETAFIGNDQDNFKVKATYTDAATVNTTGVDVAISIDPATSDNYELTVLNNATGKITSFEIANVELLTDLTTGNLVHGTELPEVPSDTKIKVTWADGKYTVYKYDTSTATHIWDVVTVDSDRTEVVFSQSGLTEVIKINSVGDSGETAAVGSKANYHKNDTDADTKTYNYLIQYDKKTGDTTQTTYLPYAQYDVTKKALTLTMSKNGAGDNVINKTYDGDADYKNTVATDDADTGKILVGLTGVENVVNDPAKDNVSINTSKLKLAYKEKTERTGLGDKDAGQKNIVFANENIDEILTGDDAACYTITDKTASINAEINTKELTVTSTADNPIAATVQYKQNAPDTNKETTATITGVNSESITYKYTVVYRGTDISDESKKDQAIKVNLVSGVYDDGKDYAITSNSPVDANNYTLKFEDIYGKITSYIVTKYVVKSMPSDVDYVYGDTVDLTGMTVEEVIEEQPSNIYTYGTFNSDTTPGWYQVTGETGSEVYQSVTAPFTVGVHNKGTDKDITAALDVDDNSSLTVANGEIPVEWTGLTNKITVDKKTLTLLFKDYPSTLPSKTYDGETKFGNIAALGVTYYQGDTRLTASGDNLYMTGANSASVGVDLTKLIVTANNKNANADDSNNLIANEDRHIVSINTENALSDADKANYNFELKYDNGTAQTDDFTSLKLQINKMLVNVTLTNYPKAVVGQTASQGTGVMANQTGKVGEQDTTGGKIAVAPATAPPSMPAADKNNFVMTYDYEYAQSLEVPNPNEMTPTISNAKFTDDNDISKNFKLNLNPLNASAVEPQPVETATAAIDKDYIHGENFDLAHHLTATINGMTYSYDTANTSLWVKNGLTVQINNNGALINLPADDTVRYDAEYAKAVTGQEYKEVTFRVTFPTSLNAVPNPASSASMMQLFAAPEYADVTVKVSKRPISVTAALNAAADGLTDGLVVREYNTSEKATNGTAEGESRITLTPGAITDNANSGVLATDTVTLNFTKSRYTETKEGVETDSPNASDVLKNITVDGIALAAKAADNNNDCYKVNNDTALMTASGRIDKCRLLLTVKENGVPSVSVGTTGNGLIKNADFEVAHRSDNLKTKFGVVEDVEGITTDTVDVSHFDTTSVKVKAAYDDANEAEENVDVSISLDPATFDNYELTVLNKAKGEVTAYALLGYTIVEMPDGYDKLIHGDKLSLNGMEVLEVLEGGNTGNSFYHGKFNVNGQFDASAREGWYEKNAITNKYAYVENPFKVKIVNSGTYASNGSFEVIKKSTDDGSQIAIEKDTITAPSGENKVLKVDPKEIKINVIYPAGLEKTYNASAVFSTIDKISGVKLEKDAPQSTLAPDATMSPEATFTPEATAQPLGENVEFDGVNGEKIIIDPAKLTAMSDTADAGDRTITTEDNDAVSFSSGVDSNDYNVIIEGSAALTINKMGINIEITNVPNAIVDQAPASDTVNAQEGTDFTVTPAVNGEAIPTVDSGNFAMSYTYTYEFNTSTDQEPTITITNPTLAQAYINNYEIIDCTAEADGTNKIDPGTTDEEHVSVNKVKKDYIHGETLSLDDLTVEINGLTYEYGSDAWNKNNITVALVNNDDTSATPAVDGKTLRYDGTYTGAAAADGKKPMTLNVTIQKAVHAVPTMAPGAVNLLDVDSSAIVLPVNLTIDKKTITSVTAELINDVTSIDKEYDGTPAADKTNIAFIPNADDIIANDKAVVTADANYTVDDIDSKDASENKKDISFVNAKLAEKANDNNNDCYKLADNLVIAKLNESGIISPRQIVVKATLPMTSVATGSDGTYTITNYTAEHKNDPTGMAFTAEDSAKFTFKATYDTSAEAEVPVTYSYTPDDTNYSIEIQGTPSTMKVEDNIPVITNIEVIGETDTDVTHGDEFDLTGITVKVTYSNDTVEEYVFTNPDDETQPAGWYLNGTKAESVPFNTNWNDEAKTPTGTYFPYDKNGNEIVVTPADPTVPGGGNIGPFNISPKVIDVTLRGNVSKVYDKTSAVTSWEGIDISFDGVVGSDVVEIDKTTSSLKYINKATGEDAIDVALADGISVVAVNLTNAGYIANVIDNTTAQITPATINFTKITVPSKTKGSKVDVSAAASDKFEATGIFEGDTVTISYSGKFASTSSVANDVAVTIDQLTIDGDERSVKNYIVGTIPAVTANVTSGGGGGGGGTSNSLTIKVITPEGKVVTITKKLTAPVLSDPVNLTAIFDKKLKDPTVIWKSEDESIVKVDENGVVSFLKVGETKVTATSKSNPNLTNIVEIVVTEALLKPTPVPTEVPHETVIKPVLNPYIIGYDDSVFGPELPISREEVATIFARLIANNIYMDESYTTRFWDVSDEDWSRDYIGYLETFDIIHGYDDGSFMPKSYITRAEMAVMMARAEGYDIEGYMAADEMDYPDIPEEYGTWATKAIDILTTAGVMQGYEDGTFRPTQPITRAETVATVNRVLKNMEVDVIEVRPSDMTDAHWAYDNVIFAMNHRILKDVAADANTFVWSEEFDKNITTKEEVVIHGSNGENISPEDSVIVPEATAQPMAD